MNHLDLILMLTGRLAPAHICGLGTLRLGLSPIVGYLQAGLVVDRTEFSITGDDRGVADV